MTSRLKFIDNIAETISPEGLGINLFLMPNIIHDITCDNCGNVVRVSTGNFKIVQKEFNE